MQKSKKSQDEIQSEADILVTKIIKDFLLELDLKPLYNVPNKEKGIDFTYEAQERTNLMTTKFTFNIQNKGKGSPIEANKNGFISLKIDHCRQLEYFCEELPNALIITYCDIINNSIYWEPIQLNWSKYEKEVKKIKLMLKNGERKTPSIQVYFNPKYKIASNGKVLKRNSNKLLQDILSSNKRIAARHVFSSVGYDSIFLYQNIKLNESLSKLDPIQAIIEIQKVFNGIKYIPNHILIRLFPFSMKGKSISSFSNGVLYTDSEKLIEDFGRLRNFNGWLYDKYYSQKLDSNSNKIYLRATEFLTNQGIHRIEMITQFSKVVNIYDLNTKNKCNTIKCLIDRLDYVNAFKKCENGNILKDGILISYGYSKLGLFVKANEIIENFNLLKANNLIPTHLILNEFRQTKLKWSIKNRYYRSDLKVLIDRLELINPLQSLYAIKDNISEELFTTLLYLINENFIHTTLYFAQLYLSEVRDLYFKDQYGNLSRNDKFESLYTRIALFDEITEGNYFDYENSAEFNLLIHSLLEGFIISYSILNKKSSKQAHIDSLLLKLFIKNVESKVLKKFLNFYIIETIEYFDRAIIENERFPNLVENFAKSIDLLETKMNENEFGENNYYLREKFNQITQNIILFTQYLNLDSAYLNLVVKNINIIVFGSSNIHQTTIEYLEQMYQTKRDQLDSKYILDLQKHINKVKRYDLFHDFDLLSLFKHPNLRNKLENGLKNKLNYFEKHEKERSPEPLLDYYDLFSLHQQKRIRIIINKYLKNKFILRLFVRSVLGNVIIYNSFEEIYLDLLKKNNKENHSQCFGIIGTILDFDILNFIEICYKFNFKFVNIKNYLMKLNIFNGLLI